MRTIVPTRPKSTHISQSKKARRLKKTLPTSTSPVDLLSDSTLLERKNYFELSTVESTQLHSDLQRTGSKIEAWSFVVHPDILSRIGNGNAQCTRYLITIDTLRSTIYFAVRNFLLAISENVSSYYSGGTADFICDAYLDDDQYKAFHERLVETLKSSKAERITSKVQNLVSVFKVRRSLVLGGVDITKLTPSESLIEEILADPTKFHVVQQNYRSKEAGTLLGGDKNVREYLTRLKAGNVIVAYKAVFDFARYFDREIVPFCRGTRVIEPLLKKAEKNHAILGPVRELLEVVVTQSEDEAEKEVSHVFINDYRNPKHRNQWRTLMYEEASDDVNLYTYPLEGTLNESPVHLSDLPEAVHHAQSYRTEGLCLGVLSHPMIVKTPRKICMTHEALHYHGVTLGGAGQGKTNTDLVLVSQAMKFLDRAIILDASKSVSGKQAVLPFEAASQLRIVSIHETKRPKLSASLDSCFSRKGIFLVEMAPQDFSIVAEHLIDAILRQADGTSANADRRIQSLLLIEEANDAFGNDHQTRQRLVGAFSALLNKASRKGWCIWVSTQYPSHLGYDNDSALATLRGLHNRIVHYIDKPEERDAFLKCLDLGKSENEKTARELENVKRGVAMLTAAELKNGQLVQLPLVRVSIQKLESPHREDVTSKLPEKASR